MVDEVEDPIIPSGDELGIAITPSKASGRTAKMFRDTAAKEAALNLEILERFGEPETAALEPLRTVSSNETLLATPPEDDEIEKQERAKEEKRKKGKNGGLKEWLFVYVPKHIEENAQLIKELEYLKNNLNLTPSEQVVFEESLDALRALQAFEVEHFKHRTFSAEEFLNKPEEEQLNIILSLYSNDYLKNLREKLAPLFNLTPYLDRIFAAHRDELELRCPLFAVLLNEAENLSESSKEEARREQTPILVRRGHQFSIYGCRNGEWSEIELNDLDEEEQNYLTNNFNFEEKRKSINNRTLTKILARGHTLQPMQDKQKFNFVGKEVNFLIQPRMMQEITRVPMLASAAVLPYLEPSLKTEFQSLCNRMEDISLHFNELKRVNLLCRKKDINPLRNDFLQDGKAKEFLSFLEEKDAEKIAYFKLLQHLYKEDLAALENKNIRIVLPFIAADLDELLKSLKGKDKIQQQEEVSLACNTIRSLLLDVLEPEFAAFTQQRENSIPAPSPDLELKDEDVVIPDEPVNVKPKLERSLSEPQLRKTQSEPQRVKTRSEPRMKRASSLKRLSGLLDATKIAEKVKSTVETFQNRFFNKQDIYAKVSFFDYAHSALHTVQVYQQVSEELGTVADPKVVGWHFTYNSVDEDGAAIKLVDKMPERFQDGDTAELYHNKALVCTVVPQKLEKDGKDEASGVGVTVHRHDEDDMDLAVDIMMASLDNKKEICISLDSSNATPESEKLILAYARVILRHGAIPIVVDGEKTLDRKSSRERLKAIEQQYPQEKKNSTPIAETYKAQVEHIRQMRKEEKRVQNADGAYLKAFDIAMQQRQEPLTEEQAIEEINKLIEIVLRGNLSESDFAKKVILCVQSTFPITSLHNSREKMHEIEEKFLLKWNRRLADYKNANKSQRKMYDDKNDKYEYMVLLGTGFFRLIQIEIENLDKLDGRDESQISIDEFDLPAPTVVGNMQKDLPAKETTRDMVNIAPAITAVPAQKPVFMADIEKGDFTFSRKAALKPLTQSKPETPRSSLLSELKKPDLRKNLKTVSVDELPKRRNTDSLQGTLFQNAAGLIIARRGAFIDERDDDIEDNSDWDEVADTGNPAKSTDKDTAFLQSLDAILQQRKLLTAINQPITMLDPDTGKQLDELAILTRLATMALIDKTMIEDAFLERVITFAFVSPKLASNAPLTPQKTEELKKELRSKFQNKDIDPQHIDELVSKLVKIARHEHSKGHTSEEIAGQHRDLYAPSKMTTVSSHHDDDGEGESRAPTMTTS